MYESGVGVKTDGRGVKFREGETTFENPESGHVDRAGSCR